MTTQLFISFVSVLLCIDVVSNGSYLHPLDNEDYETLKMLIKGTFKKQKKDGTWQGKIALVRFWRARGRFKVRDRMLFFDEKEVSLILVKF